METQVMQKLVAMLVHLFLELVFKIFFQTNPNIL